MGSTHALASHRNEAPTAGSHVKAGALAWALAVTVASAAGPACGGAKKAAEGPGDLGDDAGVVGADGGDEDAGDAAPKGASCKLPRSVDVPFKHSEKPKLTDVPTDGVYVSWDAHTYPAQVKVEFNKAAGTFTVYAKVEEECGIAVELPFAGEPTKRREYKDAWGAMKGVFHVPNKGVTFPTDTDVDNQPADGARVLKIDAAERAASGAGRISGTLVATGKNADGRVFWVAGVFKDAPYFTLK